jgi:methyl-accepting chemotaxis protein
MVNAVTSGTAASFAYRLPQSKGAIQYYSAPFTIGYFLRHWTLVIGVSRSTIMGPVYRMLVICAVIGVFAIVFISAGVFLISRPINTLTLMLQDISEGEGDLTKTISITAQNEIGSLAHYFNLTIDKIKRLVVFIRKEASALLQTGEELAKNVTESSASINGISATI